MYQTPHRLHTGSLCLIAIALFVVAPFANAAELRLETVNAWNAYVKATERRIATEEISQNRFLSLDYQNASSAARDRRAILSGDIRVEHIRPVDSIEVPDGMIHHWRGSVFIPGVTLDFVMSRVENPKSEDTKQEDVLDSSVLQRSPGQLKLYLKLQRSKIVTVIYNTEHDVRYKRLGDGRAASSSVATKIAEIERLAGNREREKPEGKDSGFLWRMNSYWRYQQVNGGVIAECESITLSRSVPFVLLPAIRPLINSVAKESMARTLQSLRTRMVHSYRLNSRISESHRLQP